MTKPTSTELLLAVLPNDDVLSQCMHCGMCLATCPTYELTKHERSSPRGRIRMVKAVARGEMEISQIFADEMNFCLDCQACETACPAGVKYGQIVEAARVIVEESGYGKFLNRALKNLTLKIIIPNKIILKTAARVLGFYQKSGLQNLLHKSGVFKMFAPKLAEIDLLAPEVSSKFSDSYLEEKILSSSPAKYKTAFLTGCLMNVMFEDINKDTVDVLAALNCDIYIPKDQVCCGSLNKHNGDFETAKSLAKKNIDAFGKCDYDFLILNSSGCGAFMKEYGYLLENDSEYSDKAKIFSSKVRDIMEFLSEINIDDKLNQLNESVTYHDACHLVHTQKIFTQPRKVLQSIPGVALKNLEESTWCCGSAGIYNITHYDDSMKLLARKMENIKETGAKIVLTGNPGCISQLRYGAKKFDVDIEVMHPVSIVKRSMSAKS
ncbi:MAG: (Fe-S)-binding protein [Ignavibacteriaceae bacterium]